MPKVKESILACCFCKFPVRVSVDDTTAASQGGLYWSDGRQHLPERSYHPRLLRCENCRKFYWKKHAPVVGRVDADSGNSAEQPEAWEHVWIRDKIPSLDDHLEALQRKKYGAEGEERYIRTMIWWQINDTVRFQKRKLLDQSLVKILQQNGERLRQLYSHLEEHVLGVAKSGKKLSVSPAGDRNVATTSFMVPGLIIEDCRLHIAEISRAIGDFTTAQKYLQGSFEKTSREVQEIGKMVSRRKSEVFFYSFSNESLLAHFRQQSNAQLRLQHDKIVRGDKKAWNTFLDMFK
jgi:hypothetical protein